MSEIDKMLSQYAELQKLSSELRRIEYTLGDIIRQYRDIPHDIRHELENIVNNIARIRIYTERRLNTLDPIVDNMLMELLNINNANRGVNIEH